MGKKKASVVEAPVLGPGVIALPNPVHLRAVRSSTPRLGASAHSWQRPSALRRALTRIPISVCRVGETIRRSDQTGTPRRHAAHAFPVSVTPFEWRESLKVATHRCTRWQGTRVETCGVKLA